MENTTPTAAEAEVPKRETKKVSAMLYTATTIMDTMEGMASLGIKRFTGSSSICRNFSSSLMAMSSAPFSGNFSTSMLQ